VCGDGIDNDCDGTVDEGGCTSTVEPDAGPVGGPDAGITGLCGATPEPLLSEALYIASRTYGIALLGGFVYIAQENGFGDAVGLLRVPKAGGDVETVQAGPTRQVQVDGDDVFWLARAGAGTTIYKMRPPSATPTVVATLDFLSHQTSFEVHGDRIYLAANSEEIGFVPRSGGAYTLLHTLEGEGHRIYGRLSVDGEYAYFGRSAIVGDDLMMRLPVAGGAAESLIDSTSVHLLAFRDPLRTESHIYFNALRLVGRTHNWRIFRVPPTGGDVEEYGPPSAPARVDHLVRDGNRLYYLANGSRVAYMPLDGGGTETNLAFDITGATGLALDSSCAYYSTDTQVFRVAK